jgi:hypothetical protein
VRCGCGHDRHLAEPVRRDPAGGSRARGTRPLDQVIGEGVVPPLLLEDLL